MIQSHTEQKDVSKIHNSSSPWDTLMSRIVSRRVFETSSWIFTSCPKPEFKPHWTKRCDLLGELHENIVWEHTKTCYQSVLMLWTWHLQHWKDLDISLHRYSPDACSVPKLDHDNWLLVFRCPPSNLMPHKPELADQTLLWTIFPSSHSSVWLTLFSVLNHEQLNHWLFLNQDWRLHLKTSLPMSIFQRWHLKFSRFPYLLVWLGFDAVALHFNSDPVSRRPFSNKTSLHMWHSRDMQVLPSSPKPGGLIFCN